MLPVAGGAMGFLASTEEDAQRLFGCENGRAKQERANDQELLPHTMENRPYGKEQTQDGKEKFCGSAVCDGSNGNENGVLLD
jgi:hypothetical protein